MCVARAGVSAECLGNGLVQLQLCLLTVGPSYVASGVQIIDVAVIVIAFYCTANENKISREITK